MNTKQNFLKFGSIEGLSMQPDPPVTSSASDLIRSFQERAATVKKHSNENGKKSGKH